MSFWLKAWNSVKPGSYTVAQISKREIEPASSLLSDRGDADNYTTPIQAVTVILTLLMAWASDTWLNGRRWPMLVLGGVVNAIVCILLAATPVYPHNRAFRWFLYYNSGWAQASNSMFWAWTQDTLAGDPATRAWASAGLNVWAWTAIATIPLGVFKTTDQPAVVAGNWTAAGFLFLLAATALALAYLQHVRALRQSTDSDEAYTARNSSSSVQEELDEPVKAPRVSVDKV